MGMPCTVRSLLKKTSPLFWQGLLLAWAMTCVYASAMTGDFIWDDRTYIVGSRLIQSTDGLSAIWTTRQMTDFWPLSYSLYWGMWRLFGMNPVGYHITGLLLHLSTVILLWRVLLRLGLRHAFLAALLFAVHPVCVESVVWIIETKTTLASLFALASALLYMQATGPRDIRYGLSLFCYLLAMLSKAAVAPWPFVLLLMRCWQKRISGLTRKDVLELVPFLFLAASLTGANLYWYSQQTSFDIPSEAIRDDSWMSRIVLGGKAFWFYMEKAILPTHLSFIYPRWPVLDPPPWPQYLPLAALLSMLVGLGVFASRDHRWLGGALIVTYIVLMLAPVLGLFNVYQMRYTFVTDHWQYYALMGAMVLWAEFLGALVQKNRTCGSILVLGVVLTFGALAWKHARHFRSEEAIWRATLAENPHSWMVHKTLGLVLKLEGRIDEAEAAYRKSIHLKPQAETLYNLAIILEGRGQPLEASRLYQEALALNPYHWAIYNNLGSVQARLGRRDDAIATYEKGLRYGASAITHYNLGLLLEEKGEKDAAHAQFQRAASLATQPQEKNAINTKLREFP